MRGRWWILALVISLSASGSNKVGNGDDGMDLEGAVPVTKGPLVKAQAKAVELLTRLNVAGIPGLGMLMPEVANAKLYVAQMDTAASLPSDEGSFHTNLSGMVYARTFAEPHSPTRFFPAALKLSEDQLVALHIHEALHRALPEAIREDEATVARITLSITSPEASHDRVKLTANDVIPIEKAPVAEEEHYKQPSNVGYMFRQFFSQQGVLTYPIERMHVVHSDLYPFGGVNSTMGFGIEASFVSRPGVTETGPLGLSAKSRIWSHRGFDFGVFGQAYLNVLSAEELKNSPFGRDVLTLGVSMRKDLSRFYVENFLSWTAPGKSVRTLGRVPYTYDYGDIINVKIRAGARVAGFDFGGFAEVHLAEHFKMSGGSFNENFGRYRILSAGPELSYTQEDYSFGIGGRFLLDATRGANFDYLGNLMGPGVSQGGMYATAKILF